MHREIITSENLTATEKDLAVETPLAWVAGKLAKDWIRERKINLAEVNRLKDGGVWPW
jgi:hypothetical protein